MFSLPRDLAIETPNLEPDDGQEFSCDGCGKNSSDVGVQLFMDCYCEQCGPDLENLYRLLQFTAQRWKSDPDAVLESLTSYHKAVLQKRIKEP